MGDGAKHMAVCRLTMSNVSSDSLSYRVPDTLRPRAFLTSETFGDVNGRRSVETGGGMKGLMGPGLGMRGEIIETRSGSLIKLVKDLGDSNRMFASRFLKRFGGGPDMCADLDLAVQLLVE